jgi:hypothetical protein
VSKKNPPLTLDDFRINDRVELWDHSIVTIIDNKQFAAVEIHFLRGSRLDGDKTYRLSHGCEVIRKLDPDEPLPPKPPKLVKEEEIVAVLPKKETGTRMALKKIVRVLAPAKRPTLKDQIAPLVGTKEEVIKQICAIVKKRSKDDNKHIDDSKLKKISRTYYYNFYVRK